MYYWLKFQVGEGWGEVSLNKVGEVSFTALNKVGEGLGEVSFTALNKVGEGWGEVSFTALKKVLCMFWSLHEACPKQFIRFC